MRDVGIWTILEIAAVILLVIYWRRKNSVWGGFTIGATIGLLLSLVFALRGNGFSWSTPIKGAVVGIFLGLLTDLSGRVADRVRGK
jgi:ABC-type uncharacterized transport system permease subunit